MEHDSPQGSLAVLIDADNAKASLIGSLLAEVAKYGRATTRRAYGDWTTPNLGSWKPTLARHAIQPMQQFSNTKGKNSTDSALIIDAMDLLYTERFDGFCIVSSDSDFTRLASRIRESGLTVYGFGERKTPQPFVKACDRFIYVEVLREIDREEPDAATASAAATAAGGSRVKQASPAPRKPATPKPAARSAEADDGVAALRSAALSDPALLEPLAEAVADAADDDGWAALGEVGNLLGKRMPDFDSRNYGYKKLSGLVAALDAFQSEQRGADGKAKAIYLRDKRAAGKPVG